MSKLSLLKVIALINSFLGIVPIVMLSLYFGYIDGSKLVDGITYGPTYSRSAGEPVWIFSILFTLIVSIIGSILSIFLFSRTGERKYLTLSFLGGVIIYWITFFNFKKIGDWKKIFSFAALLVPALSLSLLGIMMAGVGFAAKAPELDEPSSGAYYEDPSFSLDPSKPNVIDIFSDGLDLNCFDEAMNNEMWNELEDFTFYSRFVTSGYFTDTSVGELLMGDSDYLQTYNNFGSSRLYKFGKEASFSDYEQQNFIGNISFLSSKVQTFEQVWSGDWRFFKTIYPDVNVMNWTLANELLGYKNIYKYAPEYAPYKAFIEKAHAGAKASYSYLTDHITHSPDHIDENGKITIYGSRFKSFKALANFIVDLKIKLSSITDENHPGVNAFDNTTIFIYGDHGSHRLENVAYNSLPKNGNSSTKNISALFVKPLKTKLNMFATPKPKNIVSDREIWAPFVRRIIKESVLDKQSPINFIETNKNFNPGRIFETTDRTSELKINNQSTHLYYNYYTHFNNGVLERLSDKEVGVIGVSHGVNGWYPRDSAESSLINLVVGWWD